MRRSELSLPDLLWHAIKPLLPEHQGRAHPLGCHRPRVADRLVFERLFYRLRTGCSYEDAALPGCSAAGFVRPYLRGPLFEFW